MMVFAMQKKGLPLSFVATRIGPCLSYTQCTIKTLALSSTED